MGESLLPLTVVVPAAGRRPKAIKNVLKELSRLLESDYFDFLEEIALEPPDKHGRLSDAATIELRQGLSSAQLICVILNRTVVESDEYWRQVAQLLHESDLVRQTEVTFVVTQGSLSSGGGGGGGGAGGGGGGNLLGGGGGGGGGATHHSPTEASDVFWRVPEALLPFIENRPLVLHRHFARFAASQLVHRVSTALSVAAQAETRMIVDEQRLLDKALPAKSKPKGSRKSVTRHNTYEPGAAGTHRRNGLARAGSGEGGGGGGPAQPLAEPTEVEGWRRTMVVVRAGGTFKSVSMQWRKKHASSALVHTAEDGEEGEEGKDGEEGGGGDGDGDGDGEEGGSVGDASSVGSSPSKGGVGGSAELKERPIKYLTKAALEAAATHFMSLVIFR